MHGLSEKEYWDRLVMSAMGNGKIRIFDNQDFSESDVFLLSTNLSTFFLIFFRH